MIELVHLTKVFHKRNVVHEALKDITLKVEKGDVFGIIGLSGAGKSTLIRCLTQLEKPSSGKIFINGVDFSQLEGKALRLEKKKTGIIFQHFNLLSSRTVLENITFPLEINHLSKKEQYNRAQELLRIVSLSNKSHLYPAELSGGEKQRVGIARALALSPSLLLSDESTSALDPKSTRQILDLLKSLNQELGLTILLITHEMEVVKAICNKVAVLHKGEIVEQGSVLDLISHPKHHITKNFLQQTNTLPALLEQHPTKSVYRLFFKGTSATKPMISQLIKNFDIEVNILLGNLECIQNTIIGTLTIEVFGSDDETEKALSFLHQNQVVFEKVC